MPVVRPSELTPEAATTARTVAPARRAASADCSTNTTPPSERT